MIYFIQDKHSLCIKIGYTAGRPEDRLKALQTGSPAEMVLLLDIPGDQSKERSLHARFADLRQVGEWFRPGPQLISFIINLKSNPPPVVCDEITPGWASFYDDDMKLHQDQLAGCFMLRCPSCGFDYNHHADQEEAAELRVDGDTRTLTFWGECGHTWSLCFGFHKGQIFIVPVSELALAD